MKNKNLTFTQIAQIGGAATFFLNAFIKNGAFLGKKLYDSYKTGVILDLFVQDEFRASLHIGEIPELRDPDHGTKLQKYLFYAYNKCDSLIYQPEKITSKETKKFPIDGGVRVNDWLVAAISGQHEIIDLGLITLVMRKCDYLSDLRLRNIQVRFTNPLLHVEHLRKIVGIKMANSLLSLR